MFWYKHFWIILDYHIQGVCQFVNLFFIVFCISKMRKYSMHYFVDKTGFHVSFCTWTNSNY